jgi:hypothetical protein
VGRRELRLSSDVLLSWRERVLESLILSVSSWVMLMACMSADGVLRGAAKTDWATASSSITSTEKVGAFVGPRRSASAAWVLAAVMALRRWMRSSCRGSSFAGGGRDALGVMAARCAYT